MTRCSLPFACLKRGAERVKHARSPLRGLVEEEDTEGPRGVAGREPARAAALATELGAELGVAARGAASYAEALDGADIACGTTTEGEPAIQRAWIIPGMHVTSVRAIGREIDDATVADALCASRPGARRWRRSPQAPSICSNPSGPA
jgi:hypothetical protein